METRTDEVYPDLSRSDHYGTELIKSDHSLDCFSFPPKHRMLTTTHAQGEQTERKHRKRWNSTAPSPIPLLLQTTTCIVSKLLSGSLGPPPPPISSSNPVRISGYVQRLCTSTVELCEIRPQVQGWCPGLVLYIIVFVRVHVHPHSCHLQGVSQLRVPSMHSGSDFTKRNCTSTCSLVAAPFY